MQQRQMENTSDQEFRRARQQSDDKYRQLDNRQRFWDDVMPQIELSAVEVPIEVVVSDPEGLANRLQYVKPTYAFLDELSPSANIQSVAKSVDSLLKTMWTLFPHLYSPVIIGLADIIAAERGTWRYHLARPGANCWDGEFQEFCARREIKPLPWRDASRL